MPRIIIVPIKNKMGVNVTFEKHLSNAYIGQDETLGPNVKFEAPCNDPTFDTYVLRDSNGNVADQSISLDELEDKDNSLAKIQVIRDPAPGDFRLVRCKRTTLTEKIKDKLSSLTSGSN